MKSVKISGDEVVEKSIPKDNLQLAHTHKHAVMIIDSKFILS
jgi:hypothetical protein